MPVTQTGAFFGNFSSGDRLPASLARSRTEPGKSGMAGFPYGLLPFPNRLSASFPFRSGILKFASSITFPSNFTVRFRIKGRERSFFRRNLRAFLWFLIVFSFACQSCNNGFSNLSGNAYACKFFRGSFLHSLQRTKVAHQ